MLGDVPLPSHDLDWVRHLLAGVFAIDDVTVGAKGGRTIRVRGRFLRSAQDAYDRLAPQCRARGCTLLLRHEGEDDVLLIVEAVIRPTSNNKWLPIVLAIATVASMLVTYVVLWESSEPTWANILERLPKGLAFTMSLLAILVAHELGHYFTARHFGVAVTLPYLIPFPLSPFGTMGAVIRMKDVPPNRRAMLLTGAAGPICGLIVAIPVLIIGLILSEVAPLPVGGGYVLEGNSLLYGVLKWAVFGRWLPSGGDDVLLHPVAFSGWAGLLVTSFNLIPAGQLDGGHIAYALLGRKSNYLTYAILGAILLLGFMWRGWFMWALLIFAVSRSRVGPLNDVSPLTGAEITIAIVLLVLFLLTFTPLPLRFVT